MTEDDDIRSRPAARPITDSGGERSKAVSEPEMEAEGSVARNPDLTGSGSTAPEPAKSKFRLGCAGWTAILVLSPFILFLIIFSLSGWVEQARVDRERADARAEQELLSNFRESLDSICLDDLRTWEPGTQNLGTSESSRWPDRVESRGGITDQAGVRKNVTCDYSYDTLEDPNFSMNQILVVSEDGAESATYKPGSEPERKVVRVSAECSQAMRAAAQVPLSADNNAEVIATGNACKTVDEWWLAVKQNPNVFGVTGYADEEQWIYLSTLCGVAETSSVCQDAEAKGIW